MKMTISLGLEGNILVVQGLLFQEPAKLHYWSRQMHKSTRLREKIEVENFAYATPFLICLTNELTGAGARRAEGTNTGHENGEAMASVGVHVELTVRCQVPAGYKRAS